MAWSLFENGKFLSPLVFSNGKTQEDVVNEILESIKQGHKIIFIRGVCGTGKSAIALNLAKEIGKTSIVVPIKSLQNQYKKDYEGSKYLLKNNGEKLNIHVITGRKNHKCKFLENEISAIPIIKRESNSKLSDIFEGVMEKLLEKKKKDLSADREDLPCKIEIKEKNMLKLKEYIKQNKHVNPKNFETIKDVKRFSVAPACPYWCPVVNEKYEIGAFKNVPQKTYVGLKNIKFIFYERKPGCSFYEQFNSYVNSDVVVFNSLKYKLESLLCRKPKTEIEIIDECDEFLDSFSNQKVLNLDRIQKELSKIFPSSAEMEIVVSDLQILLNHMKRDIGIKRAIEKGEILPLKKTGIYDLLNVFLKNADFLMEVVDEESYLFEVEEAAYMFKEYMDDAYVTFSKKDEAIKASIITTNLAKKFKEMVDLNKIIVLMSGTIHSEEVLKNVFGIGKFKIIEAETEQQGQIEVVRTGKEKNFNYANFYNGQTNRKEYLLALESCLQIAKKPVLVHVNSFSDLPSEKEISEFELKNLMSKEKLAEEQENDKTGKIIEDFKKGKINVLFSTKASRGVDFPGEQCNSIIFTKFPNPDVKDPFWRVLEKTKPQHYWPFYRDKARRELLQKIYRGLRFKNDHVYLLSPDARVLEAFER